ncbi:uncharacterized protein [Diabrotica undecimpunctata]|uniref:uncharacterized protein isoform X2 n=1 Tax=Diabrotica undecimpunctata TaxID=50387 RepID=UPI003B637105
MDKIMLPIPVKIEDDSEDKIKTEVEVIDLDDYTSSEERIRRWNSKVRRKIIPLYDEDEACKVLFSLMKWYTATLLEDVIDTDICDTFIQYLNSHLNFYYYTFVRSKFQSMDQYLSHMEDILAINLDYEIELFMKDQKKYRKHYRQKMLRKLQTLLFYDTDSYLNVLLKVKLDISSEASKIYWNFIFKFVLSKGPKSTTDLDFCRAYILHKKWKKVNNKEMHKMIDDMLYTIYSRGPEDVASNQPLQEISKPPDEVLDFIVDVDNYTHICKSFIAYVIKKNEEETMRQITEGLEKDDSDDEQLKALREVYPIMSQVVTSGQRSVLESIESVQSARPESIPATSQSVENQIDASGSDQIIDLEIDDLKLEDDCIIIGEGTVDCLPEDTQMVHEILDDDDDIASIIYFAPKERSVPSFLESIEIPESIADKENRNPKEKSTFGQTPVTQSTFKLQSSNSVQSREKQSRKFTRKKTIDSTMDLSVDLDSVESIEHPSIDIIDDEQVADLCSDELSQSFSVLETPPTSNEQQEEEDAECLDDNTSSKEIESNCYHSPHSTFSNNSDLCNVSTSEQNKVQYTSPTSPDISSTFEPNDIDQEASAEENSIGVKNTVETSHSIKNSTKPADSAITIRNSRIMTDVTIETADSAQNSLISTDTAKDAPTDTWYSENTSIDDPTSSTTVLTEDSTTQKEEAAVTKTVTRKNGHIEHNNNDVDKESRKNMFKKQLNVSLTRVNLHEKKSGDKILFTSKSKLNKVEEGALTKYQTLTKHIMDDCLTGALGKISRPKHMDDMIDFLEDISSPKPNNSTNIESASVSSNSDVDQGCSDERTTAESLKSPEYDSLNFDTLPDYIDNFEEESSRTSSISARTSQKKQEEEVPTKKRRICFADEVGVDIAPSADKAVPKFNKQQGILKKPKVEWRIPPRMMNLQSLAKYRVLPTDACLQGDLFVEVENMHLDMDNMNESVDRWLLNKKLTETSLARIDYDKSNPLSCKGDIVHFNDGSHWRLRNLPLPELINEGQLANRRKNGRRKVETDGEVAGTSSGPPEPPSGRPNATTALDSVYLTWNRPFYDGGKMIQGYAVDCLLVGSQRWKNIVEDCQAHSYVVRGLEPGVQYVFRIRALNVHGYSKPSLESQIVELEEDKIQDLLEFEPKIPKKRSTLVNENRRQNGKRKLKIDDDVEAGTSWGVLGSSDAKNKGRKGRSKRGT